MQQHPRRAAAGDMQEVTQAALRRTCRVAAAGHGFGFGRRRTGSRAPGFGHREGFQRDRRSTVAVRGVWGMAVPAVRRGLSGGNLWRSAVAVRRAPVDASLDAAHRRPVSLRLK